MPRPSLKITGLHIEGMKALRRVDWPADGMGWNGAVPDLVMVGGANGSGKTTLLQFIVTMLQSLESWHLPFGSVTSTTNGWISLEIASANVSGGASLAVGDASFCNGLALAADDLIFRRVGAAYGPGWGSFFYDQVRRIVAHPPTYTASDFPGVVYLPSDRSLDLPEESFKSPGRLTAPQEFVYTFRRPATWKESLEGLLYSARWEDLNAKEEGRPQDATRFQAFAEAFALFFEGSKQVAWRGGELVVALADGTTTHGLDELSSGEKQMIVLAAELLYRWRPGSLILIDEPESHMHPTWQTRLWSMLTRWQGERGGQVIVATQSNHLFRIGEPGTKVLLGRDDLA